MDNKIIRSQDTCSVIEHIAGNPAGRELAYNFVIKHWDVLYKRFVEFHFLILNFVLCHYTIVLGMQVFIWPTKV